MKKWLLLIFLFPLLLSAQDSTIDSLKLALKTAKHDTTRCNILHELVDLVSQDEWPLYYKQLLQLSEENVKKNFSIKFSQNILFKTPLLCIRWRWIYL